MSDRWRLLRHWVENGFSIRSTWDGKGVRDADKDLSTLGSIAKGVGGIAAAAFGAAAVVAANWGREAVVAGVKSNTLMQTTRKSLSSMLGSAEAAEKQLEVLRDFGKESPIALPVWVAAQQQMIAFGVETEKVVPLLAGIQDAVLAGGGGEQNISRVVEIMARMSSSAKITQGDLNVLGTEGINAAKIVAEEFGKTESEMRTALTDGTVTVEEFFDAFTVGAEKTFGGVAEGIRETMVGALDRVAGAQRRIGEILMIPFIDPEGGGAAVDIANSLADALNKVEDALRPLAEEWSASLAPRVDSLASAMDRLSNSITTEGIRSFLDNMKNFAPLVGGAGVALTAAFGKGALGALGLSTFARAINPIAAGLVTLVALSPELRSAFGSLFKAFEPLIPVLAEVARILAEGLMDILPIVADLIRGPVVSALNILVPILATFLLAALRLIEPLLDGFVWLLEKVGPSGILAAIGVGLLVKGLIALTVGSAARAGLAIGKVTAAMLLLQGAAIKAMIAQGKAFLVMTIGWAKASAIAMIHALRIAAAWIIALGPIGLIVVGIAVVVALVIKYWDDIKDAAERVWNAIWDFVEPVWENIKKGAENVRDAVVSAWEKIEELISPIIEGISNTWDKLASAVEEAWNNVRDVVTPILEGIGESLGKVKEAFEGLKEAVSEAWNNIRESVSEAWGRIKEALEPLIQLVKDLWEEHGEAVKNMWEKVSPILKYFGEQMLLLLKIVGAVAIVGLIAGFEGFAKAVSASANGVTMGMNILSRGISITSNIIGRVVGFLARTIEVSMMVIRTVIRVVTSVISSTASGIKSTWESLRLKAQFVFDFIGDRIQDARDIFNKVKDKIGDIVDSIKGFWDGLRTKAEFVFDFIGDRMEDARDVFNNVKNKFSDIVDSIKGFWDDLKDKASSVFNTVKNLIKKPIKFVIETVYNDGIRKFWNFISDNLFGGKAQLKKVHLGPGWAEGGPVHGSGTWTSDSVPARLSRGEHVWTAREVAAAGGHGRVMALRSAVMRGRPVSAGPEGNSVGLFKGGILSFGSQLTGKSEMDLLIGGALGISAKLVKELSEAPGKLRDMYNDIAGDHRVKPLTDMVKSGVKKAIDMVIDSITEWMSFGGADGTAPGDYKAMSEWIQTVVPGTSITSGLRVGDPGYHGRGQAIDMAFSDGSERKGGGLAETAFNAIRAAWMPTLAELIWDFSPLGYGVGVWNSREHKFNSPSSAPPSHNDHIHWASKLGDAATAMGAGSSRWGNTVTAVLKELGLYSTSHLTLVLRAIQKESSGNPNNINLWDSNARAGIPSKGLLQTIDPTFYAYAGKYSALGPYHPYANIYAAIRYAQSRYGSGWAARMAAPGGYAMGGAVSYDRGGYLPPGYTLAYNGTGKPEPVGHDLKGGNNVTIVLNNPIVASKRDAVDLVLNAVEEAKQSGRWRD